MLNDKLVMRAALVDFSRRIDLLVTCRSGDCIGVGQPVIMNMRPEGEYFGAEPTLSLSLTSAQTLMDDLWNCGIRPTEGTGSAGSLAATQKHLQDMRLIAFDRLKIKDG